MNSKTVKFGSLYEIPSRNGLTKPSKIRGAGYKMINMGELFANSRIYDIPMELVPLKESEKKNAKVEKNDLLFARQSLVLEGAGKCSIVMETSPLTVFESHLIRVRLNSCVAVPMFYYYYFQSSLSPIKTIVIQCAQAGIRASDLEKLDVICPPVEVQHKVADVLSKFDLLIENNQKQMKLLEEAAQRLYTEWFVNLHFPGYETSSIKSEIPNGWEVLSLKDVFSYVRGKSYSSKDLDENNGILMVNLKNIKAFGGYNYDEEKHFLGKFKETQTLNAGDIVMGVTDMTQERRLVGRAAIIPDYKKSMTFSMDLIKLIPKSISNAYLYSTIQFGGLGDKISLLANGVNVLHLKPEMMMNMQMLIPPRKVMKEYDQIFMQLHRKKEKLQCQCRLAREARDRVLPKLMSGEIEV